MESISENGASIDKSSAVLFVEHDDFSLKMILVLSRYMTNS